MYVYIYIYTCIYTHSHTYIQIHTHIHTYIHTYIHTQDDARTLFRDQGGCLLVCDVVLLMASHTESAFPVLTTLALLAEKDRDAQVCMHVYEWVCVYVGM